MSDFTKILPHYTYAEYQHWEGKCELIDGIPYAMSPLPEPKHQKIAGNLFTEFRLPLKACNSCVVYQPIDYLVKDDTILQPDMLVVCGEITRKYLDFSPALVTEILSPATALKDRHTKYDIYQKQGIQYYIIISPEQEEVEIYELENGIYNLKTRGRDIQYDFNFESCKASIQFKEIW